MARSLPILQGGGGSVVPKFARLWCGAAGLVWWTRVVSPCQKLSGHWTQERKEGRKEEEGLPKARGGRGPSDRKAFAGLGGVVTFARGGEGGGWRDVLLRPTAAGLLW